MVRHVHQTKCRSLKIHHVLLNLTLILRIMVLGMVIVEHGMVLTRLSYLPHACKTTTGAIISCRLGILKAERGTVPSPFNDRTRSDISPCCSVIQLKKPFFNF